MNEIKHNFFGKDVSARIGLSGKEIVPISVVDPESSDAWRNVFLYDNSVGILETDSQKLQQLVSHYQSKSQRTSNFIFKASTMLVAFISGVERVIRGIIGSFFGFGIIGIILVISLVVASLVFSLYALIAAAPFVVIGYSVKWFSDRKAKHEVERFQQAILSGISLQKKNC